MTTHTTSPRRNRSGIEPDHKGVSQLTLRMLGKIHKAGKFLFGVDGEFYRDTLYRITGRESAADLVPEDLPDLQAEFRSQGWNGYLLTYAELQTIIKGKYADCNGRNGRPNQDQLKKLEARFKAIQTYATISPRRALRLFLEKRFGISDVRLLDHSTYEAALTAVKRLLREHGQKRTDRPMRRRRRD